MRIFATKEWEGFWPGNYYWNEYRLEGNEVVKYKCHRYQLCYSGKYSWEYDESYQASWFLSDSNMPRWIRGYLPPIGKRQCCCCNGKF